MFNQLVKWTIIAGLWRKYKRQVSAVLLSLLALVLINYIHLDYTEYAMATQAQHLGWSYAVKWLLFIGVLAACYFYVKKLNKDAKFDSKLHKMMKVKTVSDQPEAEIKKQADACHGVKSDPFANIRQRDKLRSEADFLVGKPNKK